MYLGRSSSNSTSHVAGSRLSISPADVLYFFCFSSFFWSFLARMLGRARGGRACLNVVSSLYPFSNTFLEQSVMTPRAVKELRPSTLSSLVGFLKLTELLSFPTTGPIQETYTFLGSCPPVYQPTFNWNNFSIIFWLPTINLYLNTLNCFAYNNKDVRLLMVCHQILTVTSFFFVHKNATCFPNTKEIEGKLHIHNTCIINIRIAINK